MSVFESSASHLDFDPTQLKQKYAEERAKRVRADGNAQYRAAFKEFPNLLGDPWDQKDVARAPLVEDIEVLVVGAGMSGIMTAGRLRHAGIDNIRIIDKAGDFGGTWYWNRYPGAACDTESYVYMPWLEEVGYMPTEKYAKGPELFEYFKSMARHFGLYENACFKTKARSMTWDEEIDRWIVKTDQGDEFRARFICLCAGSLAQPKLPDVQGVENFKGHMFLTCRWDYKYTGGSPSDPQLVNLRDKRVAIIGTGCTAIQAAPSLAEWSKHLFVYQRTPSMVNYRGNQKTDSNWAENLKPGWQEERVLNFEAYMLNAMGMEDLVADGWTDLARKLSNLEEIARLKGDTSLGPAELAQLADFRKMEEARARVADVVENPATAESLKPYYNVHCKRPAFHDEFLPTFNRKNVTLVHTDGGGVQRITENGIVANGHENQVDCIIFSTGFEALSMTYRAGEFGVFGVDGKSLESKWGKEFKSLHGVFTRGFPNMMVIGQIRDGGGSFNATFPFSRQAIHVAEVIKRSLERNATRIEVTEKAEDGWAEKMREKAPPLGNFLAECTPGYLNNEGNYQETSLRTSLYGGGALEYAKIIEDWRKDGMEADLQMAFDGK
jgi:cation diffusion facilitator CzcD-associated flavoprotein CzcO